MKKKICIIRLPQKYTCLVILAQFSCDDRSAAATGWFTNPEFPSPSTSRLSCTLSLDKASGDVQQIRLDFVTFEVKCKVICISHIV